ncbi:PREDICTED: protein FAM71B [Elephantulus edwardii]|uniref:protein FAM71B n=1 Tax=Elephantulus edwardii TaxID=28737 RepID=UPI0003F0718C|nr:PREDICTED: protein FAM71B [Elephantulus edwardii]
MNDKDVLPYYTANSYCSKGMFNTSMGDLQRQLYRGGEYDIFKYAPMFESDFIQISKKGEVIDIHNHVQMVTMGIASTSPVLPLPDVMLVARPARVCENHNGCSQPTQKRGRKSTTTLELTRLLPLNFVKISIHNREKQQLRLKLATGRTFYLQLCPSSDGREDLFCYWEKIVYLLRPKMETYSSNPSLQTGDLTNTSTRLTDDNKSIMTADLYGEGDRDEGRLRKFREVSEATSSAYAGGEGIGIKQPSHGMPGPSSAAMKSPGSARRAAATGSTEGPSMGAAITGTIASSRPGAAKAGAAASPKTGGAVAGTRAGSTMGPAVAGKTAGHSESTVSVVIDKASGPTQKNVALAGGVTKSPRVSRGPSKVITGTASVSSESANKVLASATRSSAERSSTQSTVATSFSPGSSMGIRGGVTANKPAARNAKLPLLSTLKTEGYMSERDGSQKVSKSNTKVLKEKKKRKSKRNKNPTKRSSHHHRKSRDKSTRKSSSHQSSAESGTRKEDKKRKGRSSTKGKGQRSSSHKSISRSPTPKESRTTQKLGRTQSSASSSAPVVSKKPSKIGSFFRSFRAISASRAVITSPERDLDIIAKTVERCNIESKMEKAPGYVQDVEITGTMTAETTETIIFASKAT